MKISIGVCLGPGFNRNWTHNLIQSIRRQIEPEDHEIILIGGDPRPEEFEGCRLIPFDENQKKGWITRKKNILAKEAQFDKLVITHDYYSFGPYWWEGIKTYTKRHPDWNILMNTVRTAEGYRSADWLINPRHMDDLLRRHPEVAGDLMAVAPNENHPRYVCGMPYDVSDMSRIQYISGGYILIDKKVIDEVPMNEDLCWGQAEDVEWSERLIEAGYTFNIANYPDTYVSIQKPNKWRVFEVPRTVVKRLRDIHGIQ